MLAEYVGKCATKIQKVFRGHLIRRPKVIGSERIAAIVRGWRLRRIMSTKEVANIIREIKDYAGEIGNDERVKRSRASAVMRLKEVIERMQ